MKSEQYWSDFDTRSFGSFIVQLESSVELADFTLRTFLVYNAVVSLSVFSQKKKKVKKYACLKVGHLAFIAVFLCTQEYFTYTLVKALVERK